MYCAASCAVLSVTLVCWASTKLFLTGAVDVVIGMFGHAYPNLVEKADFIKNGCGNWKKASFLRTLKQGCELLNEEIEKLKAANKTVLDGATAFKLNDTFGFPVGTD